MNFDEACERIGKGVYFYADGALVSGTLKDAGLITEENLADKELVEQLHLEKFKPGDVACAIEIYKLEENCDKPFIANKEAIAGFVVREADELFATYEEARLTRQTIRLERYEAPPPEELAQYCGRPAASYEEPYKYELTQRSLIDARKGDVVYVVQGPDMMIPGTIKRFFEASVADIFRDDQIPEEYLHEAMYEVEFRRDLDLGESSMNVPASNVHFFREAANEALRIEREEAGWEPLPRSREAEIMCGTASSACVDDPGYDGIGDAVIGRGGHPFHGIDKATREGDMVVVLDGLKIHSAIVDKVFETTPHHVFRKMGTPSLQCNETHYRLRYLAQFDDETPIDVVPASAVFASIAQAEAELKIRAGADFAKELQRPQGAAQFCGQSMELPEREDLQFSGSSPGAHLFSLKKT